jgi:hypothetical protein
MARSGMTTRAAAVTAIPAEACSGRVWLTRSVMRSMAGREAEKVTPISRRARVFAFVADGAAELPDDNCGGHELDHRVQAEPG